MKPILLALLFATGLAAAEPSTMPLGNLTLSDGRTLKNVVVRRYDIHAGKVLLLADGMAMLVPIDLIPAPHAERILAESKRTAPDLVQTTAVPPRGPASSSPSDNPPSSTASSTAPESTEVPVPTPFRPTSPSAPPPAPASPAPAAPVSARKAHRDAAVAHARRYYKYEYRTGSNAIAVTEIDIAVESTAPVPGWSNRFRTVGKVYLEVYDSAGGSFRRTTSRFEILTEEIPDEEIAVLDFSRK